MIDQRRKSEIGKIFQKTVAGQWRRGCSLAYKNGSGGGKKRLDLDYDLEEDGVKGTS